MDSLVEKVNNLTGEELEEYGKHLMVGGGTPGPCIVKGKGVRLTDADNKSYIDCTSQSWAMYLGFANEEIRETVHDHMASISHIHQGFHTKQRYALANELASIAPAHLNRVSFTASGGLAIEAAMKIALKNRKGARHFISLWDAYHGNTLTAGASSWTATRAAGHFTGLINYLPALNDMFIRVPNPYCYRCYFGQEPDSCNLMCAEMLKLTIEKGVTGPVAGVIVEPIQASGGQIPCPKRYLQKVREICDEFGALLIYDEIQTYCRIGEFFAAQYYEVEPDVIVLGKGLGAGLPIAAIIVHDKLEGFSLSGEELHTFANNSVSQIAALKQIEIIKRDNILDNVNKMGKYLADGLLKLQKEHDQIGDVRQVGLHIGVELVKDRESKEPLDSEKAVEFRNIAIEKGVIFGTAGYMKNIIKVKPPLIVNRKEADEILEVFEAALKAIF